MEVGQEDECISLCLLTVAQDTAGLLCMLITIHMHTEGICGCES